MHAAFGLWVYVGLVVFRVMILLLFGDLLFWVCVQNGLWWLWGCGGFSIVGLFVVLVSALGGWVGLVWVFVFAFAWLVCLVWFGDVLLYAFSLGLVCVVCGGIGHCWGLSFGLRVCVALYVCLLWL